MGLSRFANSSGENGKRETTKVRSGINNRMMMGNPTAAGITHKQQTRCIIRTHSISTRQKMEGDVPIVCVIANVALKAVSCTATKRRMRDLRTRRSGSLYGVIERSMRR